MSLMNGFFFFSNTYLYIYSITKRGPLLVDGGSKLCCSLPPWWQQFSDISSSHGTIKLSCPCLLTQYCSAKHYLIDHFVYIYIYRQPCRTQNLHILCQGCITWAKLYESGLYSLLIYYHVKRTLVVKCAQRQLCEGVAEGESPLLALSV